jgi:hypothetical protein
MHRACESSKAVEKEFFFFFFFFFFKKNTFTHSQKRTSSPLLFLFHLLQHLAELPVPDAFAYEEPPFSAGSEEFVSFQRRMHYALWLIHAKLHGTHSL